MGEDATPVPMRRHRVVCVAIGGLPNQLVDAGIGLPFLLAPLDFVFDVPQARDRQTYRVVRVTLKRLEEDIAKFEARMKELNIVLPEPANPA